MSNEWAKRLSSDTLVIAALTAISYLVGYAYRAGYAQHFGFPEQLTSPSAIMVLQVAFTLGSLIFTYFAIADCIWTLAPKSGTAIARSIRRFLGFSLLMGSIIIPLRYDWKSALILFGLITAVRAIYDFVIPLITQRGKADTYEGKLALQQQSKKPSAPTQSLYDILRGVTGGQFLRLLFISVFVIALSYHIGGAQARGQEDFYLFGGSPNTAVLAIEGEIVIAAPFDPQTNTLNGSFEIWKLNDGKPWVLRKAKLGSLKPSKNVTSPPIPSTTYTAPAD